MGAGRLTDSDWDSYSSTVQGKPIDQVFTRSTIKSTSDPRTSFDPITIQVRESRDSDDHPHATPISLVFDDTGTMGQIPHYFVEEGLGILMKEIYDRKPVPDPQIMCIAVGDAYCDRAPLQATQFESDIRIAKQIQELYIESGGGGNGGESYNLAHYFMATKTSTDAFEKRGEKGWLITIGDEPPHEVLKREHATRFVGTDPGRDLTSKEIVDLAKRQYNVLHVVVEQGAGFSQYGEKKVIGKWTELLGEGNVLRLFRLYKAG